MIKEQDIRIGDLVKVSCDCILPEGSVCVVTQINTERFCKNRNGVVTLRYADGTDYVPWGVWCNSIEGIPLTPKILENNGWKLYEPSTKMYIKSNSNLAVCFPPHSDKVQVYYVVEHLRTIKYVHEFQHILWALGMDADMKIPDERKKKEDELMIQYFKDLAPFDKEDELYEKYGFSHKDAIAWLEKQGEHANFLSKIQAGDKVTRNEDGVLVNLSQLNRVSNKQGDQNLLYVNDNAKEMFIKALERVEEQNKKGYKLTDCDKNSWWEDFKAYTSCIIEQKPALSEKDNEHVNSLLKRLDGLCRKEFTTTRFAINDDENWLESLKERYTWKPSDEQIEALKQAKTDACGKPYFNALASLYINLKGY